MRALALTALLCAGCLNFEFGEELCRENGRCDPLDSGPAGGGNAPGGGVFAGGGDATGGGRAAGGGSVGGGQSGGGSDAGNTGGGSGGGFVVLGNFAFVTSSVYSGDFGGPAKADEICAAHALDAGLPGTFHAYLGSVDGGAAATKFSAARGWVRTDGKPFIDTFDDYFSRNAIFYPLIFDEHAIRTGAGTWTGTLSDGGIGETCVEWTSKTGSDLGTFGAGVRVDGTWTSLADLACNSPNALNCFAVDRVMPLVLTAPTPHRIAFLTTDDYALDAGLAQADGFCQAEAADAGLTGQFLALLATHDAGAAVSRFAVAGGPWVRVDGVPLKPTAAGFLGSGPGALDVTLNVSPKGVYLGPWNQALAWTGTTLPTDAGSLDCASWTKTTPDAGGLFGYPDDNSSAVWFGSLGAVDFCGTPHHLYCLQR